MYTKFVVQQEFFQEFAFNKKVFKTPVAFKSAENVGSSIVVELERSHQHRIVGELCKMYILVADDCCTCVL